VCARADHDVDATPTPVALLTGEAGGPRRGAGPPAARGDRDVVGSPGASAATAARPRRAAASALEYPGTGPPPGAPLPSRLVGPHHLPGIDFKGARRQQAFEPGVRLLECPSPRGIGAGDAPALLAPAVAGGRRHPMRTAQQTDRLLAPLGLRSEGDDRCRRTPTGPHEDPPLDERTRTDHVAQFSGGSSSVHTDFQLSKMMMCWHPQEQILIALYYFQKEASHRTIQWSYTERL
jgi:hypothetical protein